MQLHELPIFLSLVMFWILCLFWGGVEGDSPTWSLPLKHGLAIPVFLATAEEPGALQLRMQLCTDFLFNDPCSNWPVSSPRREFRAVQAREQKSRAPLKACHSEDRMDNMWSTNTKAQCQRQKTPQCTRPRCLKYQVAGKRYA